VLAHSIIDTVDERDGKGVKKYIQAQLTSLATIALLAWLLVASLWEVLVDRSCMVVGMRTAFQNENEPL